MKQSNSVAKHIGLLILRVVPASAMLTHGLPKLQKLIEGGNIRFKDPLGIGDTPSLILAVIGEVVAPALLIIGLKTRFSAVPAAATMAVALFMVHWGDPFKKQELALLYLTAFIVIVFLGGGNYSLDTLIGGRQNRRKY